MKKLLLVIAIMFAGVLTSFAQTSSVNAIGWKMVSLVNGKWEAWPKQWNDIDKSNRPEITVTSKFKGTVYEIRFKWDDFGGTGIPIDKKLLVQHNEEKTKSLRKQWNNEKVFAYKDEEGDWVYTENFSLFELTDDTDVWTQRKNALIHFRDEDTTFLFK